MYCLLDDTSKIMKTYIYKGEGKFMSKVMEAIKDDLKSDLEKTVIGFLVEKQEWSDVVIERKSDAEWDFSVEGRMKFGFNPDDTVRFQAGPKLALIREASWPSYAGMSDYPEMVEMGDWSGVRDSCAEAKDAMFEAALEDLGLADTPRPGLR